MYSTIVHELTHIWHIRRNHTTEIVNRAYTRLEKIRRKSLRENKLLGGDTDLGNLWGCLRLNLFLLHALLVEEGIARFIEGLETERLTFELKSVKRKLREASSDARKLDNASTLLYDAFQDLVSAKSKGYGYKHIVEKRYRRAVKRMETVKSLCRRLSYSIGSHIYHYLLAVNEKVTIEELSKMNHKQLLRRYERAALANSERPVVSIIGKKGIFSFPKHVALLTKLRKE